MKEKQRKVLGILIGTMIGVLIVFFIFKGTGITNNPSGQKIINRAIKKDDETILVPRDDDEIYAVENKKGSNYLTDREIEKNQKELEESASIGKKTGSALSPTNKDGTLKFPYVIPGTKLEIQKYESYDGFFLEDGSNEPVKNIPVILLKNRSDIGVEYAHITMKQGDKEMVFDVVALPPGGMVAVQEKNKAKYSTSGVTNCIATVAERENFEKIREQIKVTENRDGSITVTNLTDKEIPCVRVFYKLYMPEEEAYIGGICYTAKLTKFQAEDSQTVTPTHYSVGNSKVVMVRTYDTVDD